MWLQLASDSKDHKEVYSLPPLTYLVVSIRRNHSLWIVIDTSGKKWAFPMPLQSVSAFLVFYIFGFR